MKGMPLSEDEASFYRTSGPSTVLDFICFGIRVTVAELKCLEFQSTVAESKCFAFHGTVPGFFYCCWIPFVLILKVNVQF